MKFQRIIQAVYFQPWQITREGWLAIHAIVKPHLEGAELPEVKSDDGETDFYGNPLPKMQITPEGVAIIPIIGTLLHHASMFEKMCGACSYDDVRRDLATASGSKDVTKIVLHIDSPGGMAMGCEETAKVISGIREAGMRVEAVSDGIIGSAAYHLAAGAERIFCTPTAIIGSIGSFSAVLDRSLQFEMMGLKTEVFKSGEVKGGGIPGTTLTDEQRADIQSRVDRYGQMFRAHVNQFRMIDEKFQQGQAFVGEDALETGFVDEIVDDVEPCFEAETESETTERRFER